MQEGRRISTDGTVEGQLLSVHRGVLTRRPWTSRVPLGSRLSALGSRLSALGSRRSANRTRSAPRSRSVERGTRTWCRVGETRCGSRSRVSARTPRVVLSARVVRRRSPAAACGRRVAGTALRWCRRPRRASLRLPVVTPMQRRGTSWRGSTSSTCRGRLTSHSPIPPFMRCAPQVD
jgi:hypothetical protein